VFVALAEEGWTDGDVVLAAAHRYLDPLFAVGDDVPDTLVLGCTHFPVLAGALAQVAGPAVSIVDASDAVAQSLREVLRSAGQLAPAGERGQLELLATDGVERFARVGATFLGRGIRAQDVRLVDL